MFKYSTGGGPGKVRMGCQVSTEESTGWWGRRQDLVGASLIWALLMLIEHLLIDQAWAIWPQGRDEKLGKAQAQEGGTAPRAPSERKPLMAGGSGISLRPWSTSSGSR